MTERHETAGEPDRAAAWLLLGEAQVAFGNAFELRKVDLKVAEGQCLVLLGPSGCGKTTLLNILAGEIRLDAGFLCAGETVLDDPGSGAFVPMQKRRFATVYQDFSLWPHMTAAANVAFGLRVLGLGHRERRERVRHTLAKVRMTEHAHRYPASLSGGQQQRIALARALAVRPRLLLLDEPLSALDAALREDLKNEISSLLREEGQTAVYVTHDQSEAFALGDRIALIRDGRVEQYGTPEELYRRPRTRFVAEFLGAANVLGFRRDAGRLVLDGIGPTSAPGSFPDHGRCFLRRESVRVRHALPGETFAGICVRNLFLGNRHEAVLEYADGLRITGLGDSDLHPEDPATVEFDADDLGLFEESA